jgi:hypothetical protein
MCWSLGSVFTCAQVHQEKSLKSPRGAPSESANVSYSEYRCRDISYEPRHT